MADDVLIPDSILDKTKKAIGIESSNKIFDTVIIMHINSVFSTLHQLGIGPVEGFSIEDSSKLWAEFLGENQLIKSVQTLMYMQVRNWFDPPTTSFALTAVKEQIQELQWRLNVAVDKGVILPEVVVDEEL